MHTLHRWRPGLPTPAAPTQAYQVGRHAKITATHAAVEKGTSLRAVTCEGCHQDQLGLQDASASSADKFFVMRVF